MVNAINAGSGRNGATLTLIPHAVLDRSFGYGAAMHILMKDIDLTIAQGEELGVPMWVSRRLGSSSSTRCSPAPPMMTSAP